MPGAGGEPTVDMLGGWGAEGGGGRASKVDTTCRNRREALGRGRGEETDPGVLCLCANAGCSVDGTAPGEHDE